MSLTMLANSRHALVIAGTGNSCLFGCGRFPDLCSVVSGRAQVAGLRKPGGRLVYATCSLLAEENEDIVAAFLAERADFTLLRCRDLLGQQGISLQTGEYLRLLPHLHGTDGFFAAAMARVP